MLRRLYDRMIEIAAGPNAIWALIAIAFAESSFFPFPPDILLIPMMLAKPRAAWRLAAYCTPASVARGMLGYAIGYYGFDLIGRPILEFYHAMPRYDAVKAGFDRWGVWIIILKGMTPIPYKLVTIASGVAHFDLLAALLWWFGPAVRNFIERRLMLVTSLFAAALVGGFVIIRYL